MLVDASNINQANSLGAGASGSGLFGGEARESRGRALNVIPAPVTLTPGPSNTPFFDEQTLAACSLDSLGRCEMRGCPDEAVGFNDQHEALCEDHLHDWAIGEDDGLSGGEFEA